MSLREYQAKRDFQKTAEPPPEKKKPGNGARFIVQKHDASRLHYDFRLEMDGVLKSWAVPKGFPWVQGERHLAVHVEDHPLDYANFEGIIPKGQYGGGTVMVWDQGEYEVFGTEPLLAIKEGKLHMCLAGQKLKGEWTLVRTRIEAGKEHWLLLKTGSAVRPVSAKRDNQSILTGRTMAQIAKEKTATWQSNREEESAAKKRTTPKPKRKAGEAQPRFIEPMKARMLESPPATGEWIYELKWDGYRAIAVKDGTSVELFSRNEKPFSLDFPEVLDAIRKLRVDRAVLDGEIVAVSANGQPSFQLLQAHRSGQARPAIFYYAFDLLNYEGLDLLDMPLCERKEKLAAMLEEEEEVLRYSAGLTGGVDEMLQQIRARGMEGLIGKRSDSLYQPGARNGDWVKLKCVNEQEFVVGGYTAPKGGRKQLGAIHVGYYEGRDFRYAGKVGTGFDEAGLQEMRKLLDPLHQDSTPFTDIPTKTAGKWTRNMSPAAMKVAAWVKPQVVCQVKFAEWTSDGALRHPVFLGIRDDKAAREVVREGVNAR